MSILEGGPFKCYNHMDKKGEPFTTASFDEWNKHCTTTPHFDVINVNCVKCGELTNVYLPFLKFLPNGQKEPVATSLLLCDSCSEEYEAEKKKYKVKR